ncbi:hypothetical protein [Hathewaya limosa]|uniref:Uncharacterized protein n=1 Tax=Hathewaya limosa TaxID=1536 RepID=A0ABU0JPN6_HATLI|nr:hypothetical protein [Hathewaya limosa]MDQ0479043.1 hypothetical protein [Hathewaya limosa]
MTYIKILKNYLKKNHISIALILFILGITLSTIIPAALILTISTLPFIKNQ